MDFKLFVGNLNWKATNEELKELFTPFGEIKEAVIILDRETRRSRGFGFVTFTGENAKENAEKAIKELNGKEFLERELIINEAREKKED